MDYLSEKRKRQIFVVVFIYFSFIALSIILLILRNPNELKAQYIINCAVDIFGMIMGYVLFICSLIDVQRTGERNLYFFSLINVAFVGLFTDLVAWLVDGLPEFRMVNLIDNTLYYMTMPFAAIFFWLYVISILRIEDRKEKLISLVMQIGIVVTVISRILNVFLGFYFTVDEAGYYSRGESYIFSMLYAFFTTMATFFLIIRKRKKLKRYQFVALLLYIFLPMAVYIFTVFSYGLSVSYGVIMVVLLLMYCVINISQGRDKVINDRDLKMAATIQTSSIPHDFPPFPDRHEFELYASMNAAKDVGGDFYDFFLVDDDHICLVMADVSGKGVPASLFMMVSKTLIKSHIQSGEGLGKAIANVNNILLDGNKMEMFVTVWAAVIEISTGKGIAINAGHEHPVLKRTGGEYELVTYRHSPAVATMEDLPFREHEFEMNPGDRLFVYTDGLPEASNSKGEFFGAERMIEVLNDTKEMGVEKVLEHVTNGVNEFVNGAEQFDDITMLVFDYKGVNG